MNSCDISKLLNANVRIYLACTGAGAGLQQTLWNVPGCSAFFVGAEFPYDQDATERFLGFRPEKFCSIETAIDLALESYSRACLTGGKVATASPIGLGLTASVASLRAHRGEHRVCAAVATRQGVWSVNVVLEKGVGDVARVSDGQFADRVGLSLILRAAGIGSLDAAYLVDDVPVASVDVTEQAREQFLSRGFFTVADKRLPVTLDTIGDGRIIFPGSFNPPHEGHFDIAKSVDEFYDGEGPALASRVVFSITATSPHKPPVSLAELIERVALLRGRNRMVTEGDALFVEKARRYPNHGFVVGADTFQRLLDPKWGQEIAPMVDEFDKLGTGFLVFGRLVDGKWTTRDDVLVEVSKTVDVHTAAKLGRISDWIDGRWDISSSELRAKAAADSVELSRRVAACDAGTAETVPWGELKETLASRHLVSGPEVG